MSLPTCSPLRDIMWTAAKPSLHSQLQEPLAPRPSTRYAPTLYATRIYGQCPVLSVQFTRKMLKSRENRVEGERLCPLCRRTSFARVCAIHGEASKRHLVPRTVSTAELVVILVERVRRPHLI